MLSSPSVELLELARTLARETNRAPGEVVRWLLHGRNAVARDSDLAFAEAALRLDLEAEIGELWRHRAEQLTRPSSYTI